MKAVLNMASYRKKDWKRFVASAEDRETLHDTWEAWRKSFLETKATFESRGLEVREIMIDLNDLSDYCRKNGLPNTSKTRAQYVSTYR